MFFIALRKGLYKSFEDDEIMFLTMGRYVHAELVVIGSQASMSCGAWEGESPSFKARDPYEFIDSKYYTFFRLPINQENAAHRFLDILQEVINSRLDYSVGWECCLPETLVKMYEKDVDYNQSPTLWKKVFCSQVILLILKKCIHEKLLPKIPLILNMHSRHCSPTLLYSLCCRFFEKCPCPFLEVNC
jgi:hypothetical protein